jgi:hypothetical protein
MVRFEVHTSIQRTVAENMATEIYEHIHRTIAIIRLSSEDPATGDLLARSRTALKPESTRGSHLLEYLDEESIALNTEM